MGSSSTRICLAALVAIAALHAQDWVVFPHPGEGAREQLTRRLDEAGQRLLRERARSVAALRTREEAERRQRQVREKILRLIGGLPAERPPLNARDLGTVDRGDYRFEKIIYESLPGFYVPANVYTPARGRPPFPAILMPVGHSPGGKEGERETAVGLARKGFVVLKYDPVGQGERLQYYDPDLRASKVGGPTQEHSHANAPMMLIGDNLARYRIWDGMRGIDYLLTRKDVDPNRIGCTGCSGGGTLTTYIAALDERVKAAAPACYITSWEQLLEKLGPQDAEQTFPRFLVEGLDIADMVELFAPKPYLIASTIEDFFPLEGARQTFEEARKFYALFDARDRLEWFVGPGPHGVPLESREAVYEFFIRHLNNGEGDPREEPAELDPPENILCTQTGQVSDSLGGETLFTLNRKRGLALAAARPAVRTAEEVSALKTRLTQAVREVAGVRLGPGGAPPEIRVHRQAVRPDYTLQLVSFEVERGVSVTGLLFLPLAQGVKPAVLAVDRRPKETLAAGSDLESLVKAGNLVLLIQPRGTPEVPPPGVPNLVGDFALAFRAALIGESLPGIRTEDVLRAVDYLASRPDVDATRISGYGVGQPGVYLLHAAVVDDRIRRVVLERAPAAYRLALERPIHRHLYEIAVPGVLSRYDLDDLILALHPRPVRVINPVDLLERPLRLAEYRQLCATVFESSKRLGAPERVAVLYRGRQPLSRFFE